MAILRPGARSHLESSAAAAIRQHVGSKRYMVDRAKIVALAEKAGITPRMVEMVAHGQRRLSATSAEAVLRALGHD